MIWDKDVLYDWKGINEGIFKAINSINPGDSYDKVMILLSRVADHHNFFLYLYALVAWACLGYLLRKINRQPNARPVLVVWLGVIAVFVVGFAADAAMIELLKTHFNYPRPYIVFSTSDIRLPEFHPEPGSDYHSFPSGHVAFMTLIVVALWPVLNVPLRWLGVLLIPAVAWSRMALGMHFPADVLGGFALTLILVMIVRGVLYSLLRKYFRLRC